MYIQIQYYYVYFTPDLDFRLALIYVWAQVGMFREKKHVYIEHATALVRRHTKHMTTSRRHIPPENKEHESNHITQHKL